MARGKKTEKAEPLAPEELAAITIPENIGTDQPEEAPSSDPEKDQDQKPEPEAPRIEELPLPFAATVNVALAVLRTAPDSALLEVRPVGTLPMGTPVTVTAIHAGSARIKNGLWIKVEFLTPDSAKNTPQE